MSELISVALCTIENSKVNIFVIKNANGNVLIGKHPKETVFLLSYTSIKYGILYNRIMI